MTKKTTYSKKELLEILETIKKYSEIGWCSVKTETLTIHTGVISFKSINGVEHREDFLKIINFLKEKTTNENIHN